MRRVVGAVTIVTGVNGGARRHKVRGIVVIAVVTKAKLRGGAKVCVEKAEKDQGTVKKLTVDHDAMLQATVATRRARRDVNKVGDSSKEPKTTQIGFPFAFVCQFAC